MSRVPCAVAAVLATVSLGACMAQTPVTFNLKSVPGGHRPGNLYTVDLNRDGLPDIVQDSAVSDAYTIIRSSSPGNFRSPVYVDPGWGNEVSQFPIAIGDFNRDGKADLAIPLPRYNWIDTLLGNGNGTFTSKITQVPPGYNTYFAEYYSTVAADFNEDGNPDLIGEMIPPSYVWTLNLFAGDGTGGFSGNKTIYSLPSQTEVHNVVVGDFNGDGHADVAFVNMPTCGFWSTNCPATLHVMYGDGKLGFRDTTPYTSQGVNWPYLTPPFSISAGDLNSDGVTDLFGVDETNGQLAVFYGQTDGTFASYFSSVPPGTFGATSAGGGLTTDDLTNAPFSPQLAMADFNADWNMDLVGFEHDANTGTDQLVFFLSTGSPGAFTTQIQPLPSHTYTTNPIVADFNRDGKPDVVLNQSDGGSSTMLFFANKTKAGIWSDCLYPAKGINVCSPYQTAVSPVPFSAAATSYGDIRKMEVWIDGKKIEQQDHTWSTQAWFHSSAALPDGTHSVSIFAVDIDNHKQKVKFSLNVGPPVCPAPSAPGIAVCAPTAGATVARPIAVQASATVDGTFARMEIWVDGVKEYTQTTTPYLDARVPAPPGSHRLDIFAANTLGTVWHSAVDVTAQ